MAPPVNPVLNFAACVIYAGTALACALAAAKARRSKQRPRDARFWLTLAGLFTGLIFVRLFGIEGHLQETLRGLLHSDNVYGERREVQAPLAALGIILVAIVLAGIVWRFRKARPGKRETMRRIAAFGAVAMVGLVALRIISLHATDKLLFSGLHLNWPIDLSSSLVVALAAWRYARLGDRPPSTRSRSNAVR